MAVPAFYQEGQPLGPIDALFTSASAVCVTGLVVEDTATFFTVWGKAWVLGLIQIGGLGILAFTTVLMAALGGRPSLRQEALNAEARGVIPEINYRRLAIDVMIFTLGIEFIGFMILFICWHDKFDTVAAMGHAAFYSISAFCNAGFASLPDSVVPFNQAPVTLSVLMVLIICGGVGFLTLEEIILRIRRIRSRRQFRISLHSRLVLAMTFFLLVSGALAFLILEWNSVLHEMPIWAKCQNALFMSVTARTAGFNSIDYTEAKSASNFATILLMSIGGAPGSTAGGLKVTTVALPGLMALSRLRGRDVTNIWRRTIPAETIQRAVGLIVLGFALVALSVLLLLISEQGDDDPLLENMFEVVSAFNTVGLSLERTSKLTAFGKILATLLMFLGRVGLPTVAAITVAGRPRPGGILRYAREDVIVG